MRKVRAKFALKTGQVRVKYALKMGQGAGQVRIQSPFTSTLRGSRVAVRVPPVSVLTSSPRDLGTRVSQGHLKLSPSPCSRPNMGAPILRRSMRHLLGISPVGE